MPEKTKATGKKQEFESAFQGLRKILRPYDKKLRVIKDGPGDYMSESKSIRYLGKPLMFASITSKSYVAFHLFSGVHVSGFAERHLAGIEEAYAGQDLLEFQEGGGTAVRRIGRSGRKPASADSLNRGARLKPRGRAGAVGTQTN